MLMVIHSAWISRPCRTIQAKYKGAVCVTEQEVNLCFEGGSSNPLRATGDLNVNTIMTVSQTSVYTAWPWN